MGVSVGGIWVSVGGTWVSVGGIGVSVGNCVLFAVGEGIIVGVIGVSIGLPGTEVGDLVRVRVRMGVEGFFVLVGVNVAVCV
jgi:hypothetical protein